MSVRSLQATVPSAFYPPRQIFPPFSKPTKLATHQWILCRVLAVCCCLLVLTPCRAQVTNSTDVQSTPIPGAGHDYIQLLNETVNPANGSVSLRINFPVPKSRGVTFPYVLTYDSNGVTYPTSSPSTGIRWATGDNYFSSGGWTYTVPHLSTVRQSVYDRYGTDQCDYYIDYVFTDPSGGRHTLGVSAWDGNSPDCAHYGPQQVLTNYSDGYQVKVQSPGTSGFGTVKVSDQDGTVYWFVDPNSAPYSAKDRNGNSASFTLFRVTDTIGRRSGTSTFRNVNGDDITISGISDPYQATWDSVSYNYNPGWTNVYHTGNCQNFPYDQGTHTVITSLSLPNGQSYHFYYNGTNGLLREIDYPTGGWVKYTWDYNPSSQFIALYNAQGIAGACGYQYGTPVVITRQVSYDGATVALTQNFTYETNWNTSDSWWDSKTTTVSETPAGAPASQTKYTYKGISGGGYQPNDPNTNSFLETPVESQIEYKDSGGSTVRTVIKAWYDKLELACVLEAHDGSGFGGVFYTYGAEGLVTDKKEYNYGQVSASNCSQVDPPIINAPANPTRETATTYLPGLQNADGFYIQDLPSIVVVSGGGITAETDYGYDQKGNLKTKTHVCNGCSGSPDNPTTQYFYANNDGQVTSMEDPRHNTTFYEYLCSDTYLSKITHPTGLAENFTFDCASGRLTDSQDESGNWSHYQYNDDLKRLTEADYPDGGKTTYSYNDATRTVTIDKLLSSGISAESKTVMDGMGHVTQSIRENGAKTDMTYDGHGQLHTQSNPYFSTSDPTYGIATYYHDVLGRLTSTVYPDQNSSNTTYNGNCATTTDPASKQNTTCSDALGRMTSVTDATGTTGYGYDALDNLRSVTQGAQTRSYHYNSLSEMYQTTNPESGTTTYAYDANGNVTMRTDARNVTTTYAYDALNRLTSKSYNDNPQTPMAKFYYDETLTFDGNTTINTKGRLSHTWNGQANTTYSYDAVGRITDYWQSEPTHGSLWKLHYNYDLAGDVISWTHPAGTTITNTISAAQQVTQIQSSLNDSNHPNPLVQNITYTPWGAIQTVTDGCVGAGCTQTKETYAYNKRLQPVTVQLGTSSNAAAYYSLAYSYAGSAKPPCNKIQGAGDNGNVTGYTYTDSMNPSLSHTATYCYDALNRLTQAIATGNSTYNLTFSYTQDGSNGQYGNMSCVTNGSTQGPCNNLTFNSANNHINTAGYAYDAAGNLTQDPTNIPTNTYQWDAEGRLRAIVQSGTTFVTNTYNSLGQLVEADYPGYNAKVLATFDASGRELGLYNGVGGYWWDQDVWAGGRMLAQEESGVTYFLHANSLGSDTQVTNQAGTVLMDMLYYPWGQVWQTAGTTVDSHFAGFQKGAGPIYQTPPAATWIPSPAG
jgi:YD repeat-containing protein